LPVEVWSQFMKAAHKGKSPSELPGEAVAQALTASGPAPNPLPAQGPPPRRREPWDAREAMRPMDPPGDWYMERFVPR
jgi:hypothetical protein